MALMRAETPFCRLRLAFFALTVLDPEARVGHARAGMHRLGKGVGSGE